MDPEKERNREALRQLISQRFSDPVIEESGDMRLFKYEVNGQFDYDLYRRTQELGNKAKIGHQWVSEDHVRILSHHINASGHRCRFGLCHGTRKGKEQAWFRKHLDGAPDIIGTEISDTADRFAHTIQWDFHDLKQDWIGAADLVYSNSWDHSYDPAKAFTTWARCLTPGGFLMLDHGENYQPDRARALDPFGISEAGLVEVLNDMCGAFGSVVDIIDGGDHKKHDIRTIVFRANPG